MFAIVTTWRLHESIRTAAERDIFVRALLTDGIEIVRRAGVLDVMMIEVEPDLLLVVSVFETEEEADAAHQLMNPFITDRFGDHLELISRVIGRAYDPPRIVGADRVHTQFWRAEADAMYANLVTWRLDPSIRPPDVLADHLRGVWTQYSQLLSQRGLLDVLVVRTSEETMLAIRLYEDLAAGDAEYQQAVNSLGIEYTSKVEAIKTEVGRAFDVPLLLGSED